MSSPLEKIDISSAVEDGESFDASPLGYESDSDDGYNSEDTQYDYNSCSDGSDFEIDLDYTSKQTTKLFNNDVNTELLMLDCEAHYDAPKINYTFTLPLESRTMLGIIGSDTSITVGVIFTRELEKSEDIPKVEIITPILHKNVAMALINTMLDVIWSSKEEAKNKIMHRISDLIQKKAEFVETNKKSDQIKTYISKDKQVEEIYQDIERNCGDKTLAVRVFKTIRYALECINQRCYVCCRKFPAPTTYPMICHYQLCRFTASEMFGIHDLTTYLREKKQIVDFWMDIVSHAARSDTKRRAQTFTNVPVDFKNDDGSINYDTLSSIIENYWKVETEVIHSMSDDDMLLDYLKSIHPSLHKTIWWAICAIQYNLKEITLATFQSETKKITGELNGYTIFKIVDNYTPKENTYQALRNEKECHHAYHGSGIHNWLSILYNGLVNVSNSGLMTAGAAYGEGIYLASDISTSLTYCRYGHHGSAGSSANRIMYICGVAEVADTKCFGSRSTSAIMTVPDANYVKIAYLLVKYQDKK